MADDIYESFGLARIGAADNGTYTGRAVKVEEDRDWRQDAACHPSHKPDSMTLAVWVGQWFPPRGGVQTGAAVCAGCPVRAECLEAAMTGGETSGVWGGESGRSLRRLRRVTRSRSGPLRAEVARLARAGVRDNTIAARTGLSINVVRVYRRDAGMVLDRHGRAVDRGAA